MSEATREGGAVYEVLGGEAGCTRLARAFYARVERDPLLRPLYPRVLNEATRHIAAFMAEFLGGPESMGRPSLREAHARFDIGEAEARAWIANMTGALEDLRIEEPALSALQTFFTQAALSLVNRRGEAPAGPAPTETISTAEGAELRRRWSEGRAADDVYAAVAAGDPARVVELGAPLLEGAAVRGTLLNVLAALGCHGGEEGLARARERLVRETSLLPVRSAHGWTLLHVAAGAWSVPFVEMLLEIGADPNARDGAGHTPLCSVANALPPEGSPNAGRGRHIVCALLRAGADPNAAGGVKSVTPLHNAARRDNVEVGAALVEGGADLEARDSQGETPLRRAVNCGQPGMVRLLLAHGADPHSRCLRGRTPLEAARTPAVQAILRGLRD